MQQSPSDSDCPFCKRNPELVFHESELVLGLWDRYPVTPGHALSVPRRHISDWFEATLEEQQALIASLEIARAEIQKGHEPDGFNIGINVGEAAGQTIFHLHVHLIPRYHGDQPDPRGGIRKIIPEMAPYWHEET